MTKKEAIDTLRLLVYYGQSATFCISSESVEAINIGIKEIQRSYDKDKYNKSKRKAKPKAKKKLTD